MITFKELDEAHKIGDKVTFTKGSEKGKEGRIGEIRKGLYKGAEKTYTVDYDHNETTGQAKSVQVKAKHIQKVKESVDLQEKHRVAITVSDPNHPMVSKRKELIQKTIRIAADNEGHAVDSAIAHYRKAGYKVHDHHYIGTVKEEVELDEVTAKEKWAKASVERQKKHDEIETKRKEAAAQGKTDVAGAVDRLSKALGESQAHDEGHRDRWYHRKPNSGYERGSQEHKDYMDAYTGKHKQQLKNVKTYDKHGEVKKEEIVYESSLNQKDPHGDYKAKRKALHDLSLNKDVDQTEVQRRRLDLDKEYSKYHKEEVEQIDEISKELAGNYVGALAKKQLDKHGMKPNMYNKLPKKHQQGFDRAIDRLKEGSGAAAIAATKDVAKASLSIKHAKEKEALALKHEKERETLTKEEVAANNIGGGNIAGTQGDAGKKSVVTKMLKRKVVDFKEFVENLEEGKQGLWANIHAKRKRIKNGSGEKMRKPGSKGAPTTQDFKNSQEQVEAQFDMIEEMVELLALENNIHSELVWEELEILDDETLLEYAIDAKGHKSSTGGLTQKGVDAYNRKTGGNLKTAVTTPPSKLKPGSKAAKRRKSFCARMSGVDGPMKDENGKPTRKALALRKWNC